MNCQPGDLAIVISAYNPENLGRIVRVLAPHPGTGPMAMVRDCLIWLAEGSPAMVWTDGNKRYVMVRGPVPDSQLQAIKGDLLDKALSITKPRVKPEGESKSALRVEDTRAHPN